MNPYLLSYINYFHPNMEIRVFTNGCNIYYNHSGTMNVLPLRILYKTYSISNILALIDVASPFRVTMDTNKKTAMFVHTVPDFVLKFYQCHKGLYCFDTSSPNLFNISANSYSLLITVQEKEIFRSSEIEGADAARIIQHYIGLPFRTNFKSIVKGNQLRNCTIKISDIDRSDAIYGPQVVILKVKYVRKRTGCV